ncbi:unnamed protein product [Dovyalis caffra]|uniref:Uncharacterized protein n=1 Tax=Dovyalis caffra TaxID=77055 RepID=A0AAV1SI33_9ROSI|nr:unnamed protein product [Dovyalis caffra]
MSKLNQTLLILMQIFKTCNEFRSAMEESRIQRSTKAVESGMDVLTLTEALGYDTEGGCFFRVDFGGE